MSPHSTNFNGRPCLGRALLLTVAWGCWAAWMAAAGDALPSSKFLRFIQTGSNQGHVDTSLTTYRNQEDIRVTLIGAVHIADAGYYRDLQKRFQKFDALLYEIVKPKEAPMTRESRTDSPIGALQIGMKNLLELEFQLDAVDYSPTNFVHADMDVESFQRLQAERGESILALMIRGMIQEHFRQAESGQSPMDGLQLLVALMSEDKAHQLKFLLAQQLENMESILAGLDYGPDGQGSVLLSGRNEVVMRVLNEQIRRGKRQLGVFYGAGHMPDLEKRLHRLGFKKIDEQWITAWDIRRKKPSNP